MEKDEANLKNKKPKVTVIIPTLNEEESIGQTLDEIPKDFADLEIMIVDGLSKDRTVEIARKKGAKVIMEKRKGQAIDKMVNPPLTGPASVRNVPVSSLPGGLTLYDGNSSQNKLESLYQVNFPIDQLVNDMDRVERRIDNDIPSHITGIIITY